MTCHSIIQFHFNLRIELKWIDFVGPVHSALTFIQFHSPFNFNALNGCEMKKESGSIPLRSVYFIQFTSWNEMKSLAAQAVSHSLHSWCPSALASVPLTPLISLNSIHSQFHIAYSSFNVLPSLQSFFLRCALLSLNLITFALNSCFVASSFRQSYFMPSCHHSLHIVSFIHFIKLNLIAWIELKQSEWRQNYRRYFNPAPHPLCPSHNA